MPLPCTPPPPLQERYIRKTALQVTFVDEIGRSSSSESVSNEAEAKKLAFYLFFNVKPDFMRDHITADDLAAFLPVPADAQAAYAMLDDDGDGTITLQARRTTL